MIEIPFYVDELNDDGASYMLEQLYGLPENCISSWSSMGAAIERNKVSLQYSSSSSDWDASVDRGNDTEYSTASNPRLAAARVLVKKALLENPSNSFALKLPLRTAFSFGLKREGGPMNIIRALGKGTDEEEKVIIELRAE